MSKKDMKKKECKCKGKCTCMEKNVNSSYDSAANIAKEQVEFAKNGQWSLKSKTVKKNYGDGPGGGVFGGDI